MNTKIFLLILLAATSLYSIETSLFYHEFETQPNSGEQIYEVEITNPFNSGYQVEINLIYSNTLQNLELNPFEILGENSFYLDSDQSKTVRVKFDSKHNVNHNAMLYANFINSESFYTIANHISVRNYFDENNTFSFTNNLWNKDLKSSLTNYLQGHKVYSYREARNFLWGSFDNDNGTVSCVYTGKSIEVTDAEPDFSVLDSKGFNTEHTWPRGYGSNSEPPLSDMNHIFPSDKDMNGRRANYPFDYVTGSITYQDGGSKLGRSSSNEIVFEPRDAHKGTLARAMLYFATRYGNQEGFLSSQESTLRSWNLEFLPDQHETNRNDSIGKYQERRNPYIDNPHFLERIISLSNDVETPIVYEASLPYQIDGISGFTLEVDSEQDNFQIPMFNSGNQILTLSNVEMIPERSEISLITDISNLSLAEGESAELDFAINSKDFNELNGLIEITFSNLETLIVRYKLKIVESSVETADAYEFLSDNYPNPVMDYTSFRFVQSDFDNIEFFTYLGEKINPQYSKVCNGDFCEVTLRYDELKKYGNIIYYRIFNQNYTQTKSIILN